MIEPSALTLLPSLLAIFLALTTRNVLASLAGGVLLGSFVFTNFHFIAALQHFFQLFIELVHETWILKTLAFAIAVGSVMELLKKSGAIDHFVYYMQVQKAFITSGRSALLLSYSIGVIIFIESSITSLIAGAVGRPLCDRYNVAHAKLAFVCDSTSAPVSSLLIFNGWGALLLGLLSTQADLGLVDTNSVIDLLIDAVCYNFYAMSALVVTLLSIVFNIELGAMKKATPPYSNVMSLVKRTGRLLDMFLPIGMMVGGVFFFLFVTGDGNILKGSGSSSIFYTMLLTLVVVYILYVLFGNMDTKTYIKTAFIGGKKLFVVALILFFAFAIGKITTQLHTGAYLASFVHDTLPPVLLAGVIFILASMIAFATGTSWGTFSIMIPIAISMSVGLGSDVALAIGAVISGGVFGDHVSPISDTTIISSLASDCDVVEHVNTQLPYALLSGGIAFILFLLVALF